MPSPGTIIVALIKFNQRPVFRSRDLSLPIRGQYSGQVICIDQWEASIQFIWPLLTNRRPVFRSRDLYWNYLINKEFWNEKLVYFLPRRSILSTICPTKNSQKAIKRDLRKTWVRRWKMTAHKVKYRLVSEPLAHAVFLIKIHDCIDS